MKWTEERVRRLVDLWRAGYSGSQIADALGGTTRTAVVSKVSRIRDQYQLERREDVHTQRIELPPAGLPPLHREDGSPITMENVTEDACRWPYGDPGTDEFCLCGRKRAPGSPYCAYHRQIATEKTNGGQS